MRCVAITEPGPHWSPALSPSELAPMGEHLRSMRRLYEEGTLILGGPFRSGTGGLVVLDVRDQTAARALLDCDPAVASGLLAYRLETVAARFDAYTATAISEDAPRLEANDTMEDTMPMPEQPTREGSPWDYLQPRDLEQFGADIGDVDNQRRWGLAVFLGGLSYMWERAGAVKTIVYDRLAVGPADRVLLLGEALEESGFIAELRGRVGDGLDVVEIIDDARRTGLARERGSGGQIGTFEYKYTHGTHDGHYDAVAVLQGVQHAEDWGVTGEELRRILKPGGRLVLAEIAFGPTFEQRVRADVHIEYVFEKLFSRAPLHFTEIPFHTLDSLHEALDPLFVETGSLHTRGIEVFWGRSAEPVDGR